MYKLVAIIIAGAILFLGYILGTALGYAMFPDEPITLLYAVLLTIVGIVIFIFAIGALVAVFYVALELVNWIFGKEEEWDS